MESSPQNIRGYTDIFTVYVTITNSIYISNRSPFPDPRGLFA